MADLRITLIDDSIGVRDKLLDILKGRPAEILALTTAPFFDDAIEKHIAEFSPHLIILDLLLKDDLEFGFRTLRRIKGSRTIGHIPVLVISKYIADDQMGRRLVGKARMIGAVDALDKATIFDPGTLLKYLPAEVSASSSNTINQE